MINHKNLKIKKPKLLLLSISLFAVFVIALPRLLYYQIPCLDGFYTRTVEYNDCNLILVSNMYIAYGIVGLIATLFTFAYVTKMKLLKEMILIGSVSVGIFLYGYYTYLPSAEISTLQSDIFLDTFHDEYSNQSPN